MIKFFRKQMNKKGFTLIELIVVIAILGILAAIAIPRFTAVGTDAQDKADKASARTILSAISIAEASLSQSGYPGASDTNPDRAQFLAKVNESLNDNVTYGTTDSDANNTDNWSINYNASGEWETYKDGTLVTP